MTREEAKEIFINRGYVNVKGGTIFDGDKWRQSVEVITEWLKEQPCDDAISRQAALSMQYRIDDSATLSTRDVINVDDLEHLPSISTEKTGHWIDSSNGWMCSECNKDNTFDTNYCPNCGAKMEVEE